MVSTQKITVLLFALAIMFSIVSISIVLYALNFDITIPSFKESYISEGNGAGTVGLLVESNNPPSNQFPSGGENG